MNENLTLIEGTFFHQEAKEILMNAFYSKINFHQLKNFSSQERFGKDDETAQKRIPELKKEITKLQEVLSDAKEKKHNELNPKTTEILQMQGNSQRSKGSGQKQGMGRGGY